MKLQSITAKFILIVSILMAFVLGIQFYFTNQTHEDILSELDRLTHSINTTTDKILVERFENDSIGIGINDNILWKLNSNHDHGSDFVTEIEENEIFAPESENRILSRNRKEWVTINENGIGVTKIEENNNGVKHGYEFLFTPEDKKKLHIIRSDSNDIKFDVIDIDISDLKPATNVFLESRVKAAKSIKVNSRTKKDNVLSFEFPTFVSTARAPQRVRYNYDTNVFSSVLDDIRNRNLLITLSLFGLSIIAIAAIAGKFLKPIKSLNQSFDKVVQGDLTVTVDSKSTDEIGELSGSFNQMVSELRKNKDKETIMHRQERLASLGQLAAGVAHEIKNPLNAINLTIEHLNDKFISEKEIQASDYIQTIQKEIRRLDKTVNNFLSYLRSENLSKKETDINALLDDIFNLYEREISVNKIEIAKHYKEQCLLILDPERFKTVLMNIVINAIQAMQNGGQIDIETNCDERTILIKDSGKGIPAKNLENIFDLFYTTKSAGTGLGLPTAYKIVKEHGGELSIESEEGKGTTVRIIL